MTGSTRYALDLTSLLLSSLHTLGVTTLALGWCDICLEDTWGVQTTKHTPEKYIPDR